ncbi:MAG TPA: ANTAR domain-containing protein [Clostridia bacterium]|jgi:AmiR/NasT family two-component response regulator
MDNILLVSKSQKVCDALKDFLKNAGFNDVFTVNSAGMARRTFATQNFSLCIIDTPLSDESASDLALYIVQNFDCSCLMLTMDGTEDELAEMVEDYGILVLTKPINRNFFYKMVKFALSSGRRIVDTKNEVKKLQGKLEDLKIVTRAKLVLMEKMKMTEVQAHKYIERQAMDQRVTKRVIAENVIKKYELL